MPTAHHEVGSVPADVLRLARVGRAGLEKPVIAYPDGTCRDVSILISEIDRALLASDWPGALWQVDPERLPAVDRAARKGPCLEYYGRFIAVDVGSRDASLRLALRAARPAGAADPIALPRSGNPLICRGGVTAVIGPNHRVGAACLFLAVESMGNRLDPQTAAVVASSPGLMSLGPFLVGRRGLDAATGEDITLTVNGDAAAGPKLKVPGWAELDDLAERVSRSAELDVGDVLLVGGGVLRPQMPGMACLAAGDTVRLGTPVLGLQVRTVAAVA
jgi:hypothetical protein